ncbi:MULTISPECIES: hypothetical protein [Glutamicibacter]|uniref:hypothetical protein n=1 Tax=Glutamicibacter TaxID=1742989 RepID=UPI0010FEEBB9|nr:hypothetical protein [Glutamicibacter sp. V16R2B1]TLK56534.1 hypothetical protein FDN03_03640 [Glutamicibacter sp. V16R2B1]
MYGRSVEEWDELIASGYEFLKAVARQGKTTSYTEMNAVLQRRTGLHGFDFSQEMERAAMGYLLGRIVDLDQEDHPNLMISSLVVYLNENNAGMGFYNLAKQKGLLRKGDSKEEFWIRQVKSTHNTFRR